MKKIVCTLNVGKNVLHDNARSSMREAARRWGADYIEILQPLGDTTQHHYYQKLHIDSHMPDNARVIYYDADVIVRSDCLSPFSVVPAGKFGMVRSHYPSHAGATKHVYKPMRNFAAKVGIDYTPELVHQIYPNNGMLMFETPAHRPVFERARKMAKDLGFDSNWQVADQGYLSVATLLEKPEMFYIPPMFQLGGAYLWSGWTPEMLTFCYHFCGPIDSQIGIPRTVWDDLGPDRHVSGSRVTRWTRGKPVHLTSSAEIPMMIREMSLVRAGKIVEIGTFLGGSTWYGAQIARDNYSEYFCVDPWAGGASDLAVGEVHYQGFMENMRDARLTDCVTVVRKPSVAAAEDFEDNSLDLVFVDGDHSRAGCSADIRAWWPKLKDGAVMLGHDYCGQLQGVIDAVKDTLGAPDEVSPGSYPIWKKTKRDGILKAP